MLRLYRARRSAFVVAIAEPHNLNGERLTALARQFRLLHCFAIGSVDDVLRGGETIALVLAIQQDVLDHAKGGRCLPLQASIRSSSS